MRCAALLVVLGACFSSTAPPPTAPAAKRPPSLAADPLAYLPADSDSIMAIDAAQLRGSALWKYVEPKLHGKLPALYAFEDRCGIKLLEHVRSFVLAGRERPPANVLVVRGDAPLRTCIERHAPELPKAAVEGGMVSLDLGDSRIVLAFANATTLVAVAGDAATTAELAKVLAAGAPLRSSAAFVDLYGQVATTDMVWWVMNGNAPSVRGLATYGAHMRGAVASLSLANGLAAGMRVHLDDAEQARHVTGVFQPRLAQIRTFVEELDLTADKEDVVLRAVMTEAQLETLAKLVGL